MSCCGRGLAQGVSVQIRCGSLERNLLLALDIALQAAASWLFRSVRRCLSRLRVDRSAQIRGVWLRRAASVTLVPPGPGSEWFGSGMVWFGLLVPFLWVWFVVHWCSYSVTSRDNNTRLGLRRVKWPNCGLRATETRWSPYQPLPAGICQCRQWSVLCNLAPCSERRPIIILTASH